MLEKIPLLNSRSILIKLIGIFAYGIMGLFILAGLGHMVDPDSATSSTTDLLDLDIGPYMVSFEKPKNYEPEIEPLSFYNWSGFADTPVYRSYFRRIAEDGKGIADPERVVLVQIRDFEEPQFNETFKEKTLRDELKLGNKYWVRPSSSFSTQGHEYLVVEKNDPWDRVGAGRWIDKDTMFTITMGTFDRGELESILESLTITEKAYSGS